MTPNDYSRGFFGVGVVHGKTAVNLGTLWRSAKILGASFVFTVGRRYKRQCSDTLKTWRHVPLYNYTDLDAMYAHIPADTLLVGVEMCEGATPLREYLHPERAIYLLGAEDHGLTNDAISRCHQVVVLPGEHSMNVAVAGSIVMYDRAARGTVGVGLSMAGAA